MFWKVAFGGSCLKLTFLLSTLLGITETLVNSLTAYQNLACICMCAMPMNIYH